MVWSVWPAHCLPRPRAVPIFPWVLVPSLSAWLRSLSAKAFCPRASCLSCPCRLSWAPSSTVSSLRWRWKATSSACRPRTSTWSPPCWSPWPWSSPCSNSAWRAAGVPDMLKASDLKITFNPGTPIETRALQGLSLEIPTGQFVTVIGTNGAGKSTFLNAVSGDLRVDSGSILIDDTDVTRLPVWARATRVARVFQDPMAGTCEDLTIEENMALAQCRGGKRGLGWAVKADQRDFYRDQLSRLGLGLENRLADRIGLLSGGQRQAVSLLMAALQPSRILLLDEHTAALDPRTADFVLELTQRIVSEKQLTTMMVTHSMRQALDVGDRTVMLHQGQVVLDVSGEQRKGMQIPDLLDMFEKVRGEKISDDALLLG